MKRRSRSSRPPSARKRRPGRGSTGRKLLAIGGLLLLLALAMGGALWSWSRGPTLSGDVIEVDIAPGLSVEQLCQTLARAGVLREPKLFGLYLKLGRIEGVVQPGVHLLRAGLSPAALAARLMRSRARPAVKVTIPEGFNQFQVAERLREREVASAQAFLNRSQNATLLAELGVPAASAEGYLFPATYDLYVDSDAELVLRTLVKEAGSRYRRLTDRHATRLRERELTSGWGLHQFVILASIVEKEAGAREENGNIASVFFNRLDDPSFRPRQMLQSDPTAGYGCLVAREQLESCARYTGIVSPAMLRDSANPYNTYKHPGLPPGPIANPSEAALEAALNPPKTPYFFFVAGSGKRHVFSRTFGEHERAISAGGAPTSATPPSATGALPGASLH
ncbi:MAG: hypothetical protein RL685_6523 [Pseudomonadota bacterium]|jgi:UPF0755 protein